MLVHSSWLLANTKTLIVAPGIANIYARDPMAMANGQRALAEQSGGRFLLGIGVSHRADGRPGCAATPTASRSRRCGPICEAMRAAPYLAPDPPEKPLTIVAALGPRMMALSGELADGAHPYNVPPEHTAEARRILGPGKLLCPEVWVLLETDPAKARSAARQALAPYHAARQLRQQLAPARALATTTWRAAAPTALSTPMSPGATEEAIRKRIQEHWDAGADHVCIQSISPDGSRRPDEKVLALLAPARRWS